MLRIVRSQRGFTLIELVIILILIGVLAGVAIPRFVDLRTEAEESKAKATQDAGRAGITLDFANQLLTAGTYSSGLVCGAPPCDVTNPSANLTQIEANIEQVTYPPGGPYGDCAAGTGFCWRIESVGTSNSPARIYGMYNGTVVDSL